MGDPPFCLMATGTGVDRKALDIAPTGDAGADARKELREDGRAGVGPDLVTRVGAGHDQAHHVLIGLHPDRVVDARLHRVAVEKPRRIGRVFGVGRGAVLADMEPVPALQRAQEAMDGRAGQRIGLADDDQRHRTDVFPMRWGLCNAGSSRTRQHTAAAWSEP